MKILRFSWWRHKRSVCSEITKNKTEETIR